MILVTGASGFLGRHIVSDLKARRLNSLTPSSSELNLLDQDNIHRYLRFYRPDVIIHAAAKVGGIHANKRQPGTFLYENAVMGLDLMETAANTFGVKKYVQLGTVCSYPCRPKTIPFVEEELWDGYPEPTNAPYGLAKRLMLVQAQAYREQFGFNAITLIPTNLYGPGDNFDANTSHVIPALITKVDEAMRFGGDVELWGTGRATRDFLYVADCAYAIGQAVMNYDKPEPLNLGSGQEVSIAELAFKIADLMGFKGEIRFDSTKPEGQPRRAVDSTRAHNAFGFTPTVSLEAGLRNTIKWYLELNRAWISP